MIFKVFVKHLSDRLLHIAKHEAGHRGYYLKRLIQADDYSVLSIYCSDEHYLPSLVDTLETDRKTRVFAITGAENRHLEFRNISPEPEFSMFHTEPLEIYKEERAAFY